MTGEETVTAASKLYAIRSTAKFMLGDKYSEMTRGMAEIIRDIISESPRKDLTPLSVATELGSMPGVEPSQVICLMATAVDMAEDKV